MNAEAGITKEARARWISRAIAATVPLLAIAVGVFAPTPKLQMFLWLTICCLAYLPIATLWNCPGTENGFVWKVLGRSFASIGAMIVGGMLGVAAHLIFHRMIHFEPLVMWAFVGSIAGLSASLLFPWLGDACVIFLTAISPS